MELVICRKFYRIINQRRKHVKTICNLVNFSFIEFWFSVYSNSNQTLFSTQTSSDDGINWGLDTAATLNFAVADKTGIFVEGRYSILLGSENGEDANQMQALAGLKLDI